MIDSYVMNMGSTTRISPKQLRWLDPSELQTVIALRGLFIVPVRTPCHEFWTWYEIFHKPSQHIGEVRKHSPHQLSRSERSGKILRDLSFLVTYWASPKHKTGCQPVLCTDIVGNKNFSKNDSERTIMHFFLFHEKSVFARKFTP